MNCRLLRVEMVKQCKEGAHNPLGFRHVKFKVPTESSKVSDVKQALEYRKLEFSVKVLNLGVTSI